MVVYCVDIGRTVYYDGAEGDIRHIIYVDIKPSFILDLLFPGDKLVLLFFFNGCNTGAGTDIFAGN